MQKRPLSMGCLVVVVSLALMVCFFHKEPESFEAYEGDTISLQGMVYQKEQKQNGLALYLEKVKVQNEASFPTVQRVVCYLKQEETEPELGSMVNVKGKLQCFQNAHNPGEFDARSYYQILRISFGLRQTSIQQKSKNYHLFREELYQLRSRLSERLSMLLPREEASLMKTILLGEKAALDEELKRLYQRNGIAHILAISGVYTLSLVYITICKTPIFCHFWAFYIPIITLFLIPIFAHNCTLSYGVIEKSIFWRKYKHLRKSLLFGERKEKA